MIGGFRMFLKRDDITYYYVNGSSISTSLAEKPLQYEPKGWEQTEIQWSRNKVYWGMFRSFTTPYQFVEDGAAILRYLYLTFGVEGGCIIEIIRQNDLTTAWEPFYTGDINFLDYIDDGVYVTVAVAEQGLKALIDVNADIAQEIPLVDVDILAVNHDGIDLQSAYTYVMLQGGGIANLNANANQVIFSNLFVIKEGGYDVGVTSDPSTVSGLIGSPGNTLSNLLHPNFCFEALIDMQFTFSMRQEILINNSNSSTQVIVGFTVRVVVADPPATPSSNAVIIENIPVFFEDFSANPILPNASRQFIADFDFTTLTPIDKDQRIYIVVEPNWGTPPGTSIAGIIMFGNPDNGELNYEHAIKLKFRLPPSKFRGYRYFKVWEKLIPLIAPGYTGTSPYLANPSTEDLDTIPYQTILTCGDELRQIKTNSLGIFTEPKLVLTLNQLFRDATSAYMMGMGIEGNNLILEHLDYFLDDSTEIADLGEATALTYEPAREYLINSLRIGYTDQNYDGLNGRDEFMTTHNYKIPFKVIKNEGNYVSDIRFDPYGIEYTRANLIGKKTTDSKSDNDVFGFEILENPIGDYYQIDHRVGNSKTGVLFPNSKYNYGRTPKRNFLRNGRLWHFICHLLDDRDIVYQTSQKNQDLVTTLDSAIVVTEKADVTVGDLPNPIAKPVIFKFRAIPLDNMNAIMGANPKGYFTFKWEGNIYKMFPLECSTKPANNGAFDFVGLATPTCDTTQLKKI